MAITVQIWMAVDIHYGKFEHFIGKLHRHDVIVLSVRFPHMGNERRHENQVQILELRGGIADYSRSVRVEHEVYFILRVAVYGVVEFCVLMVQNDEEVVFRDRCYFLLDFFHIQRVEARLEIVILFFASDADISVARKTVRDCPGRRSKKLSEKFFPASPESR